MIENIFYRILFIRNIYDLNTSDTMELKLIRSKGQYIENQRIKNSKMEEN